MTGSLINKNQSIEKMRPVQNSIIILFAAFLISGCGSDSTGQKEAFSPREHTDASMVADAVIYDVVIKNPNIDDHWAEECLMHLDRRGLVDMVFEAIYRKELVPFDYISSRELTLKDIKNLEDDPEFSRENVGKIQFNEEWYFDRVNLRMEKRVNSISFGYEVFDVYGNLRGYKPAFMVRLN
jgi:hypothetical protein